MKEEGNKHRRKNPETNLLVRTQQIPLKSGNRDDIVQWIYDINIVEWYTTFLLRRKVTQCDVMDKIQDIYVEICKIPQERWDDLYEQGAYSISAYVTGIIHQQIVSDTSTVYRKYNLWRSRFVTMEQSFWEAYYNGSKKEED